MSLATRAASLTAGPPSLVTAHFRCMQDAFELGRNPDGFINLGTSENHLLWDIVGQRLAAVKPLSAADTHYDYLYGSKRLRSAVAQFLSRMSGIKLIDANGLTVTSGASAALEMLLYCICEAGDRVLIPAPYYAGFDFDLEARIGVGAVPVLPEQAASMGEALEQALAKAKGQGSKIKALLVTNPGNPTGAIYDRKTLLEMEAFCRKHDLHCIFDEIYAHSCFGENAMVSALALFNSDRVHVLYGFAKDFGLSGFKVGVVHTHNKELNAALHTLAYFSPVSTSTQHLLADLLEDTEWIDGLLHENRIRLAEAYQFVALAMQRYGIVWREAEAGLFLLINLSAYLAASSASGEMQLWEQLLNSHKVNISPGCLFKCSEPGWFRLCFAHPQAVLRHGVVRLQNGLQAAGRQRAMNRPQTAIATAVY
jgi:1-aminocyclopropane-1-carboxylate synthase 1/2/6